MRKLAMMSLCWFLFSTLAVTSAWARERPLDGHWEGAINQPTGALTVTVDFATNGTLKGTFSLPASAIHNWPINVSYAAPKVKFTLPSGLSFEGRLQGGTIRGNVPSPTGGHIDGFYLKRKAAVALPYTEEDVTFESDGVALTGTLRLPLTKGRHPAVFLLQGSGDSDRTAESFYADHFAGHGIATLVYDKRGTGSSGGDYRNESFADFASDALAGVRYLQGRKEINAKRVGLYGRSHGGMVAPVAASLSRDVAFIVNVSGGGVPPYQQMTYQIATEMRRDGFSETEIAEGVAYMNLKWEVARREGEGWDALQAATQGASGKKWLARVQPATKLEDIVPSWKLQMGHDPMPILEKVQVPVLALFGELDTSTPVPETIANYRKALAKAGNNDRTIEVFPQADHSLLVWPKPGDRSHWPILARGYLDSMTAWIKKQGSVRK